MGKYEKLINDTIKNNKIALFMKGTPQRPECGFSARVAAILEDLDVNFAHVNIYEDHPYILSDLKELHGWPTSPQLYIDGELVGGCDIVMELYESGELEKKLGLSK